jgi:hypothetical protein
MSEYSLDGPIGPEAGVGEYGSINDHLRNHSHRHLANLTLTTPAKVGGSRATDAKPFFVMDL